MIGKKTKIFGVILLVPVLGVIVFVLCLPLMLGSAQFKNFLQTQLSANLNQELRIEGDIDLRLGLSPVLRVNKVVVENPDAESKDSLASFAAVTLQMPIYRNLVSGVFVDEFSVEELAFSINDGEEKRPVLIKSLKSKAWGLEGEASFHTLIELDGKSLAANIKLTSLESLTSGDASQIVIDASSSEQRVLLQSKIRDSQLTEVFVDASGDRLSKLNELIGVKLPDWNDYHIRTELSSNTKAWKDVSIKNLDIVVGENDISGNLEFRRTPFYLSGEINSKNLDLPSLATKEEKEEEPASDEPVNIPFDYLSLGEADVRLRAQRLRNYLGLEFENVDFVLQLKDEALSIPSFSADMFGGRLNGDARIKLKQFEVRVSGDGLGANPITRLFGGTPLFDGDFSLQADLKAQGENVEQVLHSLGGELKVSSEHATLANSTLKTVSSDLFGILSPLFKETDKAEIECVLYAFDVAKGVATAKEHVTNVGGVFVFSKGTLNFPTSEVDLRFHVSSKNPTLASLIPPFRMSGGIADPSFLPTVSGTVASVVDTSEGVARGAVGVIEQAGNLVTGKKDKSLTGLALCEDAYKREQELISSRAGRLLE